MSVRDARRWDSLDNIGLLCKYSFICKPAHGADIMQPWTFNDIPDQAGRTAIVTGANTGIGRETARMLALKGAHVVLACRNPGKGRAALAQILAEKPAGRVELETLDLSDLGSVAAFAAAFARTHERLDILVYNAGVIGPPLGRT